MQCKNLDSMCPDESCTDVVLPALNERPALPWVLGRMPAGYRAIVVDNGSDDGTGDLADELGALVVREPRRGFGSACYAGLAAAKSDVVCFMDCDGSLDPRELPRVADLIAMCRADLVVGERRADRGSWPLHARLANRALAAEFRRRTGLDLRDLGPMRAVRRQPLLELGIVDRRSGWPLEMVLRAADDGWRIRGVAIAYHRRSGRSKVTGTLRGTVQAIRDMSGVMR